MVAANGGLASSETVSGSTHVTYFWAEIGGVHAQAWRYTRRTMVAPRFDESKWPICSVYLPATPLNDQEFGDFVNMMDALYSRRQTFGVLLDARSAPPLAANRRKVLAERGDAAYAAHPGILAGFAVVMSSAVQRGIFTAINWLVKPTYPSRAFVTLAEAETWLLSQITIVSKNAPAQAPSPSR